jgi:ribosomal protein S18 acetylase RimI-like enzyme
MSSPSILIRFAQASDQSALLRLEEEAHTEAKRYRGLTPDSMVRGTSIVAVVGSSIVGYLNYVISESHATITSVHVHVDAREVGIGDSLVHFAISVLKKDNVEWISASAQPGDRDLKNLFERHGLVAQRIIVGKSLSDPSTAERASQ